MGAIIDIRASTLFAFGYTIPLHESPSNHLLLILKPEVVSLGMLTTNDLIEHDRLKLHVHFGHS